MIFVVPFLTLWVPDSFFLEFSTLLNEIIQNEIRITTGILVLLFAGYLTMNGLSIE